MPVERENVQDLADRIGRGLIVAAMAVGVVAALIVAEMALSLEDELAAFDRDLGFTDYSQFLYGYSLGAVTIVSILAIGGLYFRWLALEQEATMEEFDMLLDALGVPIEDEDDQPTVASRQWPR